MAYTHTNSVRYSYKAGGETTSKTVDVTATGSGEINISEEILFHASTHGGTHEYDITGFEFQTASNAVSTYFLLEGVNGAIWANGSTGTKIVDLDDGVPYVWSKNGVLDFPSGTSNKMVTGTAKLTVIPDAYDADTNPKHNQDSGTNTFTITARVLYDATP